MSEHTPTPRTPCSGGKRQENNTMTRKEQAIKRAEEMIKNAKVGDVFCTMGSCPSGPTFSDFVTYDGTEKSVRIILYRATRGGLVLAKNYRNDIWQADMRTD
jgi:hypothetical protein